MELESQLFVRKGELGRSPTSDQTSGATFVTTMSDVLATMYLVAAEAKTAPPTNTDKANILTFIFFIYF